MGAPIDGRIGVHDSHQFEVKLDYTLETQRQPSRYSVETYFFIPKSLGIHKHTYDSEQFYSDVQTYIRFQTPDLTLASLADAKDPRSPLSLVHSLLPAQDVAAQQRLGHELRLFACMVNTALRQRALALRQSLQEHPTHSAMLGAIDSECTALLGDLHQLHSAMQALHPKLAPPHPHWLAEVHAYADEYIGFSIETHLTMLVDAWDHVPEPLASRAALAAALAQEQTRLGSTATPDGNAAYLYRRGLLKKFVTSVLFLDIRKERDSRHAHLFAAVAAGLAMVFATGAALLSQQWYTLNSLPFLFTLILSYILKDRIKEGVKHYFAAKLTRWLWDYNVRIDDPETAGTVGRCRESVGYLKPGQVPAEVLRQRQGHSRDTLELDLNREVILRYEKDIRLKPQALAGRHGRLQALSDIMRFNVGAFLGRTDDPLRRLRWYDAERDIVSDVTCPKVYHVHVVFALRARHDLGPPHFEHVRVILDKHGIRSLQTGHT